MRIQFFQNKSNLRFSLDELLEIVICRVEGRFKVVFTELKFCHIDVEHAAIIVRKRRQVDNGPIVIVKMQIMNAPEGKATDE